MLKFSGSKFLIGIICYIFFAPRMSFDKKIRLALQILPPTHNPPKKGLYELKYFLFYTKDH